MITKEENALLNLIRSMNVQKVEPQRKKTVNDTRKEANKYVRFLLDIKNLR